MSIASKLVKDLLEDAGVGINGNNPWDIRINSDRFYRALLTRGSLGLGEAYMDGWWDCKALDEASARVLSSNIQVGPKTPPLFPAVAFKVVNMQSIRRAFRVGEVHYDIGNDFYRKMLDKRMVYTCGYWSAAANLDEAQEAKLDLVCRKIGLKPGMTILDIGCGWGSFLKYAAEKYGVEGVGITISKEQAQLARENCMGLPIKIKLQDYRELSGKFDHVVSLGMFEHVGPKNYREYMRIVRRVLSDDGLFLLQTIGGNSSATTPEPWLDKYIFPGGIIPSMAQIGRSIEGYFVIEDWHNFGTDYDKTLMAWYRNFSDNWKSISNQYGGERFRRMWEYYLLTCAGSFRARKNNLWQIVLSKNGVPGGYVSIR